MASGASGHALGPIDTNHRFVRKKASGAGEMRVFGKRTIGFDVWGGFATINYCNGVKSAGVPDTYTTPWPIGSYSVAGVEAEIEGDVILDGPDGCFEPPFRLIGPDRRKIYTTEQAMLTALVDVGGTVSTNARPPLAAPALFLGDHDLGPAPSGANIANMMFGWVRVQETGKYAANNRPIDFSGTVILDAVANKTSGFAQVICTLICISPVITGGRVVLCGHRLSSKYTSPSIAGITIPSHTIEYKRYAAALVGGV